MTQLIILFGTVSLICALCGTFSYENRERAKVWMKLEDEIDKKSKEDG